jgi:hypothetical protein
MTLILKISLMFNLMVEREEEARAEVVNLVKARARAEVANLTRAMERKRERVVEVVDLARVARAMERAEA